MTPRQTELAALPELLSVAEAAHALRCAPITVKRAIKAGSLKKNGNSRRFSKITKESLIVFIASRETTAPVHDVVIDERYEDAPQPDLRRVERNEAAQPYVDSADAFFAAECKRFADMLPPVEKRFVQQHPKPFSFEDYFA